MKKQVQRRKAFEQWLSSLHLRTESTYLQVLRETVDYVKRFAVRWKIPAQNRIPSECLPKVSVYEFYRPDQLRDLYMKSKGRRGREQVGVGDKGFFQAALGQYIKWLRMEYPTVWKKEPLWDKKESKSKPEKGVSSRKCKAKKSKRCTGRDCGYVYIMTNPSFKKDWVKIGKTKNSADVRRKTLDNTSVPLPFEVYATLETENMTTIETLLHNAIDEIAPNKRIRPNREFFNIKPERALKLLQVTAKAFGEADNIDETYKHPSK